MAITAHLENSAKTGGQRREPRRQLRLEAQGALATGDSTDVVVHDVSVTGLLLESTVSLSQGDTIEIDLPFAGPTGSKVVWSSGNLYGCQFEEPISAAALSAAQLQSAVGHEVEISARPPSTTDESLGVRLQRLRKGRGLTQSQIAAALGVSKPTVWAWEQGRARPVDDRIEALAQVLGVSAAELLSGVNASALQAVLAKAREQVASEMGTSPDNVRIMIEL